MIENTVFHLYFFHLLNYYILYVFVFQYVVVKPDQVKVLEGFFVPSCPNCGWPELEQAVGIIGAIVMPHNFYLHSALVKSRDVNRKDNRAVSYRRFAVLLVVVFIHSPHPGIRNMN